MERELKLRVAKEDLDALRHAPLFAKMESAAGAPRLLTSTYFDTPALTFHDSKASLRVRTVGNDRVQTLKLQGSVQAGLFERDEFEGPVDSDVPELARLHDQIPEDTDPGKLVRDELIAAQLEPVFVTRISR